jgi:hypothetical protein
MAVAVVGVRSREGDGRGGVGQTVQVSEGVGARLWGTTFGPPHQLVIGTFPVLDPVRRGLRALGPVLGLPTETLSAGSSDDGLGLFYSVEGGGGGGGDGDGDGGGDVWWVGCRDEHGCWMEVDAGRGENRVRGVRVAHQVSKLYPRRQGSFEVLFGPSGTSEAVTNPVGELRVVNPRPWRGTEWVPEPVPAVREVDGLRVTFLGYSGSRHWQGPKFRVEEGGMEKPEWRVGRLWFRDVTGNEHYAPRLCRHEAAWQIEASFERVEGWDFGGDEALTLWTGELPAAGQAVMAGGGGVGSGMLQGVRVGLELVAGPGEFEFEKIGGSGWRLVSGKALAVEDRRNGSRWWSEDGFQRLTIMQKAPWVKVALSGVDAGLTWHVQVRDERGGVHRNRGWTGSGGSYQVGLEVPEGVGVRDVRLVVQRWRTVAFTVAPPEIDRP